MMKKILGFILILLTFLQVFSQDEDGSLKPSKGDWGFTFNLSGLIRDLKLSGNRDTAGHEILFFKHYIKDNMALRLGFGYNSMRNSTFTKDSTKSPIALVQFDSLYSTDNFVISLGLEKHIGSMRRLDPYYGGDLKLQFLGKEKISWDGLIVESAGNTTIEGEKKTDGGFGIGVFALVGFNYFITEKISMGGEYHFGYNYLKTGGNVSEREIVTPPSGDPVTSFEQRTETYKSAGFQVNSTAQIIFSIFF